MAPVVKGMGVKTLVCFLESLTGLGLVQAIRQQQQEDEETAAEVLEAAMVERQIEGTIKLVRVD